MRFQKRIPPFRKKFLIKEARKKALRSNASDLDKICRQLTTQVVFLQNDHAKLIDHIDALNMQASKLQDLASKLNREATVLKTNSVHALRLIQAGSLKTSYKRLLENFVRIILVEKKSVIEMLLSVQAKPLR